MAVLPISLLPEAYLFSDFGDINSEPKLDHLKKQ